MQHFNESQTTSQVSTTPIVLLTEEQEDVSQTNVFSFLRPQGQHTVGDYLAHLEQGLAKADFASKALSTFERDDALREIQNHLASLIIAYQELGDDEPRAIRSAIAQFGAARDVSSSLRRAERRQYKIAVGPEIVVPLVFFSLALLTPVAVIVYDIPMQWVALHKVEPKSLGNYATSLSELFGWPALIVMPLLAGAFAGNRSGKRAGRGLYVAASLALGTALLFNWLFAEDNAVSQKTYHELRILLAGVGASWLVSASFGIAFARGVRIWKRKGKVA